LVVMADPTESEFMTVAEVARRLRVQPNTILRWIYAKRISAHKLGGPKAGWRISRAEVDRLIDESRFGREA